MIIRGIASVAAASILMTALAALPAQARAAKEKQPRAETTSLDGRNTGRPRTCGHDTFVYDSRGVPVGPYCH